jgi:hypothetical protein
MCLQQIRPDQKRTAVRQLYVGHLQLYAFATNISPVFAPVELEYLARLEHQRHKCSATGRLGRALALALPLPHKGRNALVGPFKAKLHKIGMHLLGRAPLLACHHCLDQGRLRAAGDEILAQNQTGAVREAAVSPFRM